MWALAARCSLRGLGWALGIGAILVGAASLTGAQNAVAIAAIVAVTLVVFAVQSAWRLVQGIEAFAEAVPAQGRAEAHPDGSIHLAWPSLNLEVEGTAGILARVRLEGQAAGQPFEGPVDEASGLAEEALESVGVSPEPRQA